MESSKYEPSKYDLTRYILQTLMDSATRPESDPDYELQEREVESYIATLDLIDAAEEEGQ